MPARSRLILSVVLACGAVSLLWAQSQDAQPTPTFRARVSAVRVDVSVTGDHDAAVADLQAADFELKEDGIEQRVETAQFLRLNGTRTSNTDESLAIRSADHAEAEAARDDVRVFVIFLDDYHVAKDQRLTIRVKEAMKAFIRQFGPNDLVAIMDPLTPLTHLKFTRAQDDLLARVDTFEGRMFQVHPVKSVIEEGQLLRNDVWEVRGAVTLSALESLATYLGGLREGRKSVLLVSQGPVMGRIDSGNEEQLRAVMQAANRGNVTINTFDPRPLGTAGAAATWVIQRMADETGGRAVYNSNEPADRLAQTIADASAYYLLGYVPSRDLADGKFHRVDVKVKRRGLRVTARRGYWAPDGKESAAPVVVDEAQQRVAPAMAALVEPKSGRTADVWVGASRGADARTRLTVAWENARRPPPPAGLRRTGSDEAAVVLDVERLPDGTRPGVVAVPLETRSIQPSETAAFEVVPGGAAALRFTLRAADGSTIDRWDETVAAPAFTAARLTLATPRLLRARSAAEARRIEAGEDALPAASRRFGRGEQVFAEVRCYPAEGEQPELIASILNSKGQLLIKVPLTATRAGTVRLRLPLTSLSPDTYVLEVTARTPMQTAHERVAFRLIP